jgi:prevent-host-death family protein
MKTMGVTELETELNHVLREIRETGETVEVISDGEPIARIVPVRKTLNEQEKRAVIESLDSMAAQIGAHWPEGVSALDAVHDVRRDL